MTQLRQSHRVVERGITLLYKKEREDLCVIVKTLFDRYGTNAAGGNVSVRINKEHIIMTPTLMSQDYLCNLSPNQILVVDYEGRIIEGEGKTTREINMHMACYLQNSEIGCVLHGHAKELMVFATLGMSMPNLTESTQKLGEITCLPFAPACSPELADLVKTHLETFKEKSYPKAMLLNKHGVLITESTLHKAYDILERLEYNAYIAYKALIYDKLGIHALEKVAYEFNLEE